MSANAVNNSCDLVDWLLNFADVLWEEAPLNWNRWVRQLHRWLSIAFTLVVIFNGVAVFKHRYTNWMGLLAVAALALMFFTGMYLFVLPYVTKLRSERRAD
jgi:cellulose synthase/poly-beta-1,6-N-acetylglucosamine synthase-like glycosyltransferase